MYQKNLVFVLWHAVKFTQKILIRIVRARHFFSKAGSLVLDFTRLVWNSRTSGLKTNFNVQFPRSKLQTRHCDVMSCHIRSDQTVKQSSSWKSPRMWCSLAVLANARVVYPRNFLWPGERTCPELLWSAGCRRYGCRGRVCSPDVNSFCESSPTSRARPREGAKVRMPHATSGPAGIRTGVAWGLPSKQGCVKTTGAPHSKRPCQLRASWWKSALRVNASWDSTIAMLPWWCCETYPSTSYCSWTGAPLPTQASTIDPPGFPNICMNRKKNVDQAKTGVREPGSCNASAFKKMWHRKSSQQHLHDGII